MEEKKHLNIKETFID